MGYIKSGKDEGATVEIGGDRHGDKGYFVQPTIFSNVRSDMKIMQEEIFGPVCSISKFKTEEEAIKLGNDTTYGLAAAIHTKDLNTSIRVARELRAGTIWLNCPSLLPFRERLKANTLCRLQPTTHGRSSSRPCFGVICSPLTSL